MSDMGALAGDAASGALLAGAVEPATGHARPANAGNCANCAAPLTGDYCAQCGQKAHLHRTIGGFLHDLVHGVLHFDGKLWRTLPLLARRPGQLTRDYIDGKRARYISPVALFLFTVFVSFALFNAAGGTHLRTMAPERVAADAEAGVASLEREIATLERQRNAAVAQAASTAKIEADLAEARADRHAMRRIAASEDPVAAALDVAGDQSASGSLYGMVSNAWRKAKANPGLLIYKLQTNAYKFSWLLIPLSLPFMWALFPFSRRFRMYDHLVFVTYSIAFMTMLVVAASLLYAAGLSALVAIPALYAPFHLYRHLRGAYGLTHAGALWRTAALLAVIVAVLVLFVLAMVALVMS